MIRERVVAAQICDSWQEAVGELRKRIQELANVLRVNEADDCGHEITAITEAQSAQTRLMEAVNVLRCGIGRAFPTEQERRAAPGHGGET